MDEEMGSTQHKKFCQSLKNFGILGVFMYYSCTYPGVGVHVHVVLQVGYYAFVRQKKKRELNFFSA